MANSVVINVRASVDAATSEIERLKGRLNNLTTTKGFQSAVMGVGMGAGMAAWNAVGGAISQAGAYLGEAVTKAAEEEAGIGRLDAALRANVAGWDGNRDAIEKVLAGREKLAFSDDDLRSSLTMLVARTKDTSKALDLQATAMDLARLKSVPLGTATTALSMALSGQGRALKELGINVADYASKEELLAAVQKVAAGQAETYGRTAQGTFESLQITMNDLQEDIGAQLLPVMVQLATTLRDDVIPGIKGATEAIGPLAQGFGFVADSVSLALNPVDAIKAKLEATRAEALDRMTASLAEGAEGWTTFAESNAPARESLGEVRVALEIVDTASQNSRRELDLLADKFREAARVARDNRLDEAWDIANLPDKIVVAKDRVADAQKELEKARGTVARAEARIRLRDAEQELLDLQNKLRDSSEDFGRSGAMIGRLLGSGIYDEVVAWNAKTRRELAGLGENVIVNVRGGNNATPERRAAGGDVWRDELYVVGERGPELFVPGANGAIVPNRALGGSASVNLNVTVQGAAIFDPYGQAAQQIANTLLPGLRRELTRQGMSLA